MQISELLHFRAPDNYSSDILSNLVVKKQLPTVIIQNPPTLSWQATNTSMAQELNKLGLSETLHKSLWLVLSNQQQSFTTTHRQQQEGTTLGPHKNWHYRLCYISLRAFSAHIFLAGHGCKTSSAEYMKHSIIRNIKRQNFPGRLLNNTQIFQNFSISLSVSTALLALERKIFPDWRRKWKFFSCISRREDTNQPNTRGRGRSISRFV